MAGVPDNTNQLADQPLEGAGTLPQAPPPVQSADQLTPAQLEAQMRWAIYQTAVLCAGASVPREADEAANAVLRLSQAVVLLDPKLVAPQGVPPDALSPARPRIPMDKGAPTGRDAITQGF